MALLHSFLSGIWCGSRYRYFLFAKFLLFSILSFSIQAQEMPVELVEELVIGNDENASEEYLFANPQHVCTDSKNNIYISDRNMSKIRVFDKDGKFLKSLGRKGQGPGEMQNVTTMVIDKDDNLIVFDVQSQRFTKFILQDDSFKTYPLPVSSDINPFWISPFRHNTFIVAGYSRETDKIIHFLSPDFISVKESLVSKGDIWNADESFLHYFPISFNLNIAVSDSEKFIIVPKLYGGVVYFFHKQTNTWHQKKVRGTVPDQKPYEIFPFSPQDLSKIEKDAEKSGDVSIIVSGPKGMMAAKILNWSAGLFSYHFKYFVHFFHIWENTKNSCFVDIFTDKGEYLGRSSLETFRSDKRNLAWAVDFLWKDSTNRFYVKDTRETPVIRVMILRENFTAQNQ